MKKQDYKTNCFIIGPPRLLIVIDGLNWAFINNFIKSLR